MAMRYADVNQVTSSKELRSCIKYQKWDYIVSDHAVFTVIPY